MNRNMVRYAEAGLKKQRKRNGYSLCFDEMQELMALLWQEENYTDGLYSALFTAFNAGFEAGARCEKTISRLKKGKP